MACPMQFFDTYNRNQIAGYPTNIRSHLVQEMAQLLDIRLTSGIVDRRCSFCEDRSHDDICRTCYGSFVEQHVTAFQLPGMDLIDIPLLIPNELGSEMLEA